MKKQKNKLITLGILVTIATGIIYIANKIIAMSALFKEMLDEPDGNNYYHWRFGDIYYRKSGQGAPLLLVHDLSAGGSGYEWKKIENKLNKQYTVYTIDLLGCGRSDKPKITYTNFIYVQLLCDFVKNVIREKTNVIASGLSTSFVIMACNSNSDLFDKNMLINPPSLVSLNQVPGKNSKMQKFLLEIPILGTMIYHILVSRVFTKNLFIEDYYFNPFHVDTDFMESYYEEAHTGDGAGKYLQASITGKYLNFNILHGLKSINNSTCIIGGKEEPGILDITEDYLHYNPAIETIIIPKAKHFPHVEQSADFLEQVGIYFAPDEY